MRTFTKSSHLLLSFIATAFLFFITATNAFAQLSGTYTIDNSISASSTNYTSFASAVSDLNSGARTDGGTAHGPGISANVTFNVTSGESFSEYPLIITYANGSGYSITFQKYGTSANPVILGNGSGGSTDAIVQINSGDKYTFDGIDLTAGNNTVEYGLFLSGSASDGCQNNTFQNGTITLNKSNSSTYGVYVNSVATGSGGRNSGNHFYNNTVTDVGTAGYYILGNGTYLDDGNQIGITGTGVSQVTNFGEPGTFAQMYGIYEAYQTNIQVFNTTIDNSSYTGDSISCITTLYGIENYSSGGLNTANIYNNTISNIANSGKLAGSTIDAIYSQALTANIYGNVITNLYHRSSGVFGILANESPGTTSIYNNKIYNLSSDGVAAGAINGIATEVIVSTLNVYNNMIYDLRANSSSSSFSVRGLWVNSATSAAHIYYNTVYLNGTSANSSFQSAALFQNGSTVATLDLRDNILDNAYDVTTGTRATAFYRANATYSNLASTSNNNLLYAGTPGSKNLLLYDGTNSEQTLSNYKSFINSQVSGAEQNSVTGDPVFVSETGTIDVHIQPCASSPAENVGTPISGYTADIDGNIRSGSAPEIGADEIANMIAYAGGTVGICLGSHIIIGTDTVVTNGLAPYTYSWSPSTGLNSSTMAQPVANPTITTSYTLTVTDNNGCTASAIAILTVHSNPTAYAGRDTSIAYGNSTIIGASPAATGGASPYSYRWYPATGLSSPVESQPTAYPQGNTSYALVVTDANGCTATDTVVTTMTFGAGTYIIPDTESTPTSFAFYENLGQIVDNNATVRNEINLYTTNHYPALFIRKDTMSFVFRQINKDTSSIAKDTTARLDMYFKPIGDEVSNPMILPYQPIPAVLNYYLPHCLNGITGVQGFQKVGIHNIYTGVDVLYAGNGNGLKYFIVTSQTNGGDPTAIAEKFAGYDSIYIDTITGNLNVKTGIGILILHQPKAYELDSIGNMTLLPWTPYYILNMDNTVSFNVGTYHTNRYLIFKIENVVNRLRGGGRSDNIEWSTFYGDEGNDVSTDIVTSPTGDIYMCGRTSSNPFPGTVGINLNQPAFGGNTDGFVVKFGSDWSRKWSTYLGGSDYDELYSIVYNNGVTDGNIYTVGVSKSTNFPVYSSGISGEYLVKSNSGGSDGIITRFAPGLGTITYSTYYGGEKDDEIRSIDIDKGHFGYAIFAGNTSSTTAPNHTCSAPSNKGFPLCDKSTPGSGGTPPYFQANNAGSQDIFIAGLDKNNNLIWSTFFGSNVKDKVYEITCPLGDASDPNSPFLYLTGYTFSTNSSDPNDGGVRTDGGFPFSDYSGSFFQTTNSNGGGSVAFIAEFNAYEDLMWSTVIDKVNQFQTITHDHNGNYIYVAGFPKVTSGTLSSSPLTDGNVPICNTHGGLNQTSGDLYIAKFATGNNSLYWSTLYDNTSLTATNPCLLDPSQNDWIATFLASPDDPQIEDKFLDMTVDGNNDLYLCGTTSDEDLQTSAPAPGTLYYQQHNASYNCSTCGAPPNTDNDVTDCFLLGFNSNNSLFWSTHFGSGFSGTDPTMYPYDFDFSSALSSYSDHLYLTGYTGTGYQFPLYDPQTGDYYYTNDNYNHGVYDYDAFITTFGLHDIFTYSAVDDITKVNSSITVYPNPAGSYLNVNIKNPKNPLFNIVDLLGRTYSPVVNTNGSTYSLDVSNLSAGLYFVRINQNGVVNSFKFVKQ